MHINVSREAAVWLGLVNHDLVKRLLWPARDRRAMGGPVQPGELVVALAGEDGTPRSAVETWRLLRADLPAAGPAANTVELALDAFERAVATAQRAAAADDLEGVLAVEAAFETLARKVKEATARPPVPTPGDSNPSR
jgi:hypothetical protein